MNMTDRWFYTPREVAPILYWDAQYIREVAREDPEGLPFPVIVHGNRTQIPKALFDEWFKSVGGDPRQIKTGGAP